jgi:hypothetical protein
MKKYQKKPVIIEAIQYTYPATQDLKNWMGASVGTESKARHMYAKGELEIVGLEDGHDSRCKHIATEGDYIIKGIKGEFYACKPEIFIACYQKIQETIE